MDKKDKTVFTKWKKEYSAVLIANIFYILVFYFLMQIYS